VRTSARREHFLSLSAVFLCTILFLSQLKAGGQTRFEYSEKEAVKVLGWIDFLINEQMKPHPKLPEKIMLSESELNSYIAHRIISEEEEVMKELQLRLFDQNRIEGKILIDLRGQSLPSFLRPQMTVFFSGKLEVNEDNIRLNLAELFLGNQRVQPMILDAIIAIGARLQNMEVTSIDDWYELPYGIKDVKTEKGAVYFYFSR
jgi:hypothetical protein